MESMPPRAGNVSNRCIESILSRRPARRRPVWGCGLSRGYKVPSHLWDLWVRKESYFFSGGATAS